MSDPNPRSLLPLRTAWFHVLLALGDGPLHGYAIRADVEERTDGRVVLWPATLYGAIRDMEAEGLIEEADGAVAEDHDRRRNYYRLTPRGRTVLAAEADRLQRLVDAARSSRALKA